MNQLARQLVKACDVEIGETSGVNEYDRNENTIYLNPKRNSFLGKAIMQFFERPDGNSMSLYHELGHAIFHHLNISKYKDANCLFGDFEAAEESYLGTLGLVVSTTLGNHPDYITKYAQTNPEEDFSDCFALMVFNKNRIPRTVKSWILKDKLVYVKECIEEALE